MRSYGEEGTAPLEPPSDVSTALALLQLLLSALATNFISATPFQALKVRTAMPTEATITNHTFASDAVIST